MLLRVLSACAASCELIFCRSTEGGTSGTCHSVITHVVAVQGRAVFSFPLSLYADQREVEMHFYLDRVNNRSIGGLMMHDLLGYGEFDSDGEGLRQDDLPAASHAMKVE